MLTPEIRGAQWAAVMAASQAKQREETQREARAQAQAWPPGLERASGTRELVWGAEADPGPLQWGHCLARRPRLWAHLMSLARNSNNINPIIIIIIIIC